MRVLYFLVDMFINTFGITRPAEAARSRAAWFILVLLLLLLGIVTGVWFFIRSVTG